MIIKKEFKHTPHYILIDNVEKIDVDVDENEKTVIKMYKNNRKSMDEFTSIIVENINVYVCNDTGKTLAIYRG